MASVFKRGGSRVTGYWYASWFDHNARRKTKCTRTTDKAAALRIASKHESDAALRRDGVIDLALDEISRESQRSVESHLIDFESKLRTANRSEPYIGETVKYIREISDACDFVSVQSIGTDGVTRFAGELKDKERSARTIGAYLTAIKGFTKWLVENHKLPRNPLVSAKKPNPKTDRRRERHALLPDEWHWLEAATQDGPERYGMASTERVLFYKAAIQIGLRSGELRSLTRSSLHLDATRPHIVCKANATKNCKDPTSTF